MKPLPMQEVAQDVLAFVGLEKLRYARLILVTLELLLLFFLYLGLRWLTARLVRRVLVRHPDAARVKTLTGMAESLAQFALGFTFLVSALALLGVNVAAILGTASVAGLAVGFGAQKLVKDVITGFFLLLEDQYAVGNYVTIGGVSGTVEEVGMRITRLRDDDGRLYILSNGDIATVCNHSRGPVTGSFDLPLAAQADLTQATATLSAAFESAQAALSLPKTPTIEGILSADATKTVLKIAFVAPPGQRPTQTALKLREIARAALTRAQIPLG